MRVVQIALYMTVWFVSSLAFAGQYTGLCKSSGEKSNGQCTGAGGTAMAAGNLNGMLAGNASKEDVNVNSGTMMSEFDKQIAQLQQAINNCDTAEQSCVKECDGYASAADSDMDKSESGGDVRKEKESSCDGPIKQKKADLEKNKADLEAKKAEASNTKEASNGGGAPPPMTPPEEDSATGETKTVKCASVEGLKAAECNQYYLDNCPGDDSDKYCRAFNQQYCASGSGNSSSQYCGDVAVGNFCRSNSSCMTCQKRAGTTVDESNEAIKQNYTSCPSDPMYENGGYADIINPPVIAAPSTAGTTVSVGYEAESLADGSNAAAGEGTNGATVQSVSGDSGNSGWGFNAAQSMSANGKTAKAATKEEEEEARKKSEMGVQSYGATASLRGPANAPTGGEVGEQFGGSLFNISSQAYESYRCKTDPRCLR